MRSLPSGDPWYVSLLREARECPGWFTIWLFLILSGVIGLAYVAGPWLALLAGTGGLAALGATFVNRGKASLETPAGAPEPDPGSP